MHYSPDSLQCNLNQDLTDKKLGPHFSTSAFSHQSSVCWLSDPWIIQYLTNSSLGSCYPSWPGSITRAMKILGKSGERGTSQVWCRIGRTTSQMCCTQPYVLPLGSWFSFIVCHMVKCTSSSASQDLLFLIAWKPTEWLGWTTLQTREEPDLLCPASCFLQKCPNHLAIMQEARTTATACFELRSLVPEYIKTAPRIPGKGLFFLT